MLMPIGRIVWTTADRIQVTLFDSIIFWESRKQRTTALSSTEAEYMAISDAVKGTIYLRRFQGSRF